MCWQMVNLLLWVQEKADMQAGGDFRDIDLPTSSLQTTIMALRTWDY